MWAAAMIGVVAPAIGGRRLAGDATTAPRVVAPVVAAVAGPHADPGPIASARPRRVRFVETPPRRVSGEDGLMGALGVHVTQPDPVVLSWPVGRLGWQTNPAQS